MKTIYVVFCTFLVTVSAMLFSSSVLAANFSFVCIDDASVNCLEGKSQLSLGVNDLGANDVGTEQVEFAISLLGSAAPTIAVEGIYFYGTSSLMFSSTGGDAGVSYSADAIPGALPGADFGLVPAALSVSAIGGQRVSAGETASVVFDLEQGFSFDDLLASLGRPFNTKGNPKGGILLGVQLSGFADPGSPSFAQGPVQPPEPVPLPAAFMLFLSGLLGTGFVARLNKRNNKSGK